MGGIDLYSRHRLSKVRARAIALALVLLVSAWEIQSPARAEGPGGSEVSALQREIAERVDPDLRPFYAARGFQPVWVDARGRSDPSVAVLIMRMETAQLDSVNPRKLKTGQLRRAIANARDGDFKDVARAEVNISRSFAQYVREMRSVGHDAMIYESDALAPVIPTAAAALAAATNDSSLFEHVTAVGWMHPLYAPMRDALLDPNFTGQQRETIWQNLDRVRALPATPARNYVLVDAASARLWMYEDGKPVDSMRVVVGKSVSQTPVMAGFIRYAIVNPYWNVPPDIVQNSIAANVVAKGVDYLQSRRYQILADWSSDPARVDPKEVDWGAVAAGDQQVRVRQLPGGSNFMGRVKFEFPNPQGIYLHDTPDKELLREEIRQLSNGCVRLEDAGRLGAWLLHKKLPKIGKQAERRIDLPQLVPVYITYLTAMPADHEIAFHPDIYGRDGAPKLASASHAR